ncbi:hypothetical protein [Legionella quateirensis]|uniref:Uncharacterized protein n=1 Tax=Legionella quateirensis TaxID=45072 RepID=A0A378KXM9_9GAMM|nr:hypothetical protein [Legionella quateirensis]KTD46311.1 hypothetical protein Lqua_2414 [Legionella quateirensis]STY18919.1 Uncharacterised protein [Legionella quateirensis]
MGIPFFQSPVPADMQKLVLEQLSPADLLKKCLSASKELCVQSILALLSRTEPEAQEFLNHFLQSWNDNPQYFAWISHYPAQEEAIKTALATLLGHASIQLETSILARKRLAALSSPNTHTPSSVSQKIMAVEFENVLDILSNNDPDKYMEAFKSLSRLSNNLASADAARAISIVWQRTGDYTEETQEHACMALIALMVQQTDEEKRSCLSAIFNHPRYQFRHLAYSNIVPILETFSAELMIEFICRLFTENSKGDSILKILERAWTKFLSYYSKLPEHRKIEQLEGLFSNKSPKIRVQTCLSIANLSDKLSLTSLARITEQLIKLFDDRYTEVQNAVPKAFNLLFTSLLRADSDKYIMPLIAHHNRKVSQQCYRCLAAHDVILSPETAERIFSLMLSSLSTEEHSVNAPVMWQTFWMIFSKQPDNQQAHYLGEVVSLLSQTNPYGRYHAYGNLAKTVDKISAHLLESLLEHINDILINMNDNTIIAEAYKTRWNILARLPDEAFHSALLDKMPLLKDDTNKVIRQETYRGLSLVAKRLSQEQITVLLPMLVDGLNASNTSAYACFIIKTCMPKLGVPARELLRTLVRMLLESDDQDTRKAALEVAVFPGMLELWDKNHLPMENLQQLQLLEAIEFNHLIRLGQTAAEISLSPKL